MFFRPQKRNLTVAAKRRRDGTAIFHDSQTRLLFVYARQECKEMTWKVRSAWLAKTNCKINVQWWSITDDGHIKNDFAQDDVPSNPVYLPMLTFHASKLTDVLMKKGKPDPSDRNLYLAILNSGRLQLDVQVNGETIIPLLVDLDYRFVRD